MDWATMPESIYRPPEPKPSSTKQNLIPAVEHKLSEEVRQLQALELAGDLDKANVLIRNLKQDVDYLSTEQEKLRAESTTRVGQMHEQVTRQHAADAAELAKRQAQLEAQQTSLAKHVDDILERADASSNELRAALDEQTRQNTSDTLELADQCRALQQNGADLHDQRANDETPRLLWELQAEMSEMRVTRKEVPTHNSF
eukprot:3830826-Pyramimonas_sp.AAC.1